MFNKLISLYLLFMLISSLCYPQVTPPTLQPGEYWTQLFSLYFDYQTNGSIRYIVQNPANPQGLCAVLMAQEDSTQFFNINRFIYYAYSSNGGKNWAKNVVDTTVYFGFPCIDIRNGIPVLSMHTRGNPPQRTYVLSDASFGGFNFTHFSGVPSNLMVEWPNIAVSSNGSIIVAVSQSTIFNGYYTTFNGTSWSPLAALPNTGGPGGQFSAEAGPNGSVYIFGTDYDSTNYYNNRLWTSNNNGLNFTLQTGSNAPPLILMSGTDTLADYIDGGKQGLYLGNEVHLVYSVYATNSMALPSPGNTKWFKKAKIIHWSSSTGIDTVAGRYNMPQMTDTLTHALVTPVCQPSMGYYNGYIYVTFTAFLRGNKQIVDDGSSVNAGEIFLTRSSDNGNTWSAPVNITNTPNIEEKHSSTIRSFILPASDSAGIYYLRDMKAGGCVNVASWGKAPVYGIYKKVGASVLGIKEDLETVREYKLFQNYPNPFNPATTISYYLEKNGIVTLKVFNILGEEVTVLINEYQSRGVKEVKFDASNLPSGIYFYSLTAGDFKDTKAMVLIK